MVLTAAASGFDSPQLISWYGEGIAGFRVRLPAAASSGDGADCSRFRVDCSTEACLGGDTAMAKLMSEYS